MVHTMASGQRTCLTQGVARVSEFSERPRVRLAELVATLSLGTDLGLGQPMEHVLRQTLVALRLGERIALGESERRVVFSPAFWLGSDASLMRMSRPSGLP